MSEKNDYVNILVNYLKIFDILLGIYINTKFLDHTKLRDNILH